MAIYSEGEIFRINLGFRKLDKGICPAVHKKIDIAVA
jgi:hypothetical protein